MRLAYNMPPMGFLNPFLYQAAATNPEAFNDIVTGDNACSAGRSVESVNCCEYSFSAQPGWDATTGLGSPNYGVLANMVVNSEALFPALDGENYDEDNNDSESTSDEDDDQVDQNRDVSIVALVFALIALVMSGYLFVAKVSGDGSDSTWNQRDTREITNPLASSSSI